MKTIDNKLLQILLREAECDPRKRVNYNFHEFAEDTLQRMLNVMEPGTYIQPHKHQDPDKREFFLILKGKLAVIEYTENGEISDTRILSSDGENYGVEIAPRIYHSLVVLKKNTVIFECKDGPYNSQTDKKFAPWAPAEGDAEVNAYLKKLLKRLNLA